MEYQGRKGDEEEEAPTLSYAHHHHHSRSSGRRVNSIRFKAPKPPSSPAAAADNSSIDKKAGKKPMMIDTAGFSTDDDDDDDELIKQYYHMVATHDYNSAAGASTSAAIAKQTVTAITTEFKKAPLATMMNNKTRMKKKKGTGDEYDHVCDLCGRKFLSVKELYYHLKKKHDGSNSSDWKTFFSLAPPARAANYNMIKHEVHDEGGVVDLAKCLSGWGAAVKKGKRGRGPLGLLRSSSSNAAGADEEEVRNAAMTLMHLQKKASICESAATASSSRINCCAHDQIKRRRVDDHVEKAAEGLLTLLPNAHADHELLLSMTTDESSSSDHHGVAVDFKSDSVMVVQYDFDLNQLPPA